HVSCSCACALDLFQKRAEATELVASATSAKQGAYLKPIALFRNSRHLPAAKEVGREDRGQQAHDRKQRARFWNRLGKSRGGPFFEPAISLTGEIEIDVFIVQIETADWNINDGVIFTAA